MKTILWTSLYNLLSNNHVKEQTAKIVCLTKSYNLISNQKVFLILFWEWYNNKESNEYNF